MGNRAECPACKSYSSNVLADLDNGNDCRSCGCPNSLLVQWENMQPTLEKLKISKCNKELLDQITTQQEEISKLKTKIHKLEKIFSYTEVLEPLIEAKNILENE